jgi:hypothetical protein
MTASETQKVDKILGPDLVAWIGADGDERRTLELALMAAELAGLEAGEQGSWQVEHRATDLGFGTRLVRLCTSGDRSTPRLSDADPLLTHLQELIAPAFALYLLDRALRRRHRFPFPWSPIVLPESARGFNEAVLRDEGFHNALVIHGDHDDPGRRASMAIATSTGHGHGLQLAMFATHVLADGAGLMTLRGELTLGAYIRALSDTIGTWRRFCAGKSARLHAHLGFRGVGLPAGATVQLPWGRLVAADDHRMVDVPPDARPPQARDGHGEFRPCGCILECDLPVTARVGVDARPRLDADLLSIEAFNEEVQRASTRTMLAVLLTDPAAAVVASPSWRLLAEPANGHLQVVWSTTPSPRRPCSFFDARQTEELEGWARALDDEAFRKIALAARRIVRAVGERYDPVDGFIDAVIAMESLVGANGEQTFRISASMSVLLSDDPSERRTIKADITKLYGLRSQVVHGSKHLLASEAKDRRERAAGYVLRAIRALLTTHRGLLQSSDRSTAILLGAR